MDDLTFRCVCHLGRRFKSVIVYNVQCTAKTIRSNIARAPDQKYTDVVMVVV
jgi:hypothetical protein